MGCLDDNTAVEFASGSLGKSATTRVESHLASCRECRTLVAALAASPHDPDSDIVTSPHAVARGKAGRAHNAAALSPTEPRGSEPRRAAEPVVVGGDTIGRYIVLRRLGAGGMGVVYSAYDPQLDRKVALKLLRTNIGLGEPEARTRLVREAQAIAQLSHPNVVAVYDVGTAVDGAVYVAMEFIEGDTLTQWLTRWDRGWRELLEVFREAGRGIAAAHSSGLLHRDFKPDNVLVGSDTRVRVTDFGLARSLVTGSVDDLEPRPGPDLAALRVTLTATGAVMGTPRYMAPEQLRGADVTAAADQFSFCVALYEALYGQHPIVGDTAAKMIEDGAKVLPPPDEAKVPTWIAPILARGLELLPHKRYPSMNALLSELAPPAPSPRRRTYVALIGAAALVLGGAATATVLVRGTSGGQDLQAQITTLQTQYDVLMKQRDTLIAQLVAATKVHKADQSYIDQLVQQVAETNTMLAEAKAKLDLLAANAPPPPVKKPALRPEGGLALPALRTSIAKVKADLVGCVREWAEHKSNVETAGITVQIRILPDGHVQRTDASGIEEVETNECVVMAIRRAPWPTSPDVTVAQVAVRLYQGEVQVTVERLGSEPAPPHIDTAGE